jgi:acetyltransferase
MVAAIEPETRRAGNPRFAIKPYPKEWERNLSLGELSVFVRPVLPEDEPMFLEFIDKVSPEDLRLRFFAPIKEFSHNFIARMTQIDYARSIAFVALRAGTREMLGVVRLHCDSNHESGEYAILLRSDLKGRGLGWKLMEFMIEYARADGLGRIEGQVLAENSVMLQMCEQLGFRIEQDPDEANLRRVSLKLV